MKIAVSFLKSKFSPADTIKKIDHSIADYIHVDIMDGKFVKETSFNNGDFVKLLASTNKPLSVHLMCKDPIKYLKYYENLNTDIIYIHVEVLKNINIINEIKARGIKCGLAINPNTEFSTLNDYLSIADDILVMSVNPGMGGQEFILNSLERINYLKQLAKDNNYHYQISVDGGINPDTALSCYLAGVDTIISGSFICMNDQFDTRIKLLKQ